MLPRKDSLQTQTHTDWKSKGGGTTFVIHANESEKEMGSNTQIRQNRL